MNATVQEIFKPVIWFIMLVFFLSVFFYAVSFSQAIGFKSYVNGQINREGGLTSQAMANINEYNANIYNSKFKVVSDSGTDKKEYGDSVSYTISGEVGAVGLNLPLKLVSVSGSSISKVR